MLLTANLKASSSALTSETGPSVCSKIPPEKQKKERRVSTTTTGLKSNQKTTAGRQTQIKVGLNGENIRTHTDGRSAHYVRYKILFSKHGATLSIFRKWAKNPISV